jgi:glucose/mannose transport system substrate-binding protein
MAPGKDFGYTTSPGTAGSYIMLSDSFGLPKGIANRDNAVAWLKLLGSVEGQDAFNPLKGALPARLDADIKNATLYNQYFQDAAKDWASNTIVPSLTHGAAAPETFTTPFADIIAQFVTDRDADVASGAAQLAAVQSGMITVQ